MKIILTQDFDELGFAGDIIRVSDGYARNFLIPKEIALEANKKNLKFMETQKKKTEVKRLKAKEDAEKISEKIKDTIVTVKQKVGEEGKLYGSVTTMDIAAQLEKQGIDIDRRKITLDKSIKNLGDYDIPIKLHPEVTSFIKLIVEAEEATKE